MRVSVIMPSTMEVYPNAAKNRVGKLHRAIGSVLEQTHENWELVVVADGCSQTVTEVRKYKDPRIKLYACQKQALWSPGVRNLGISKAEGDLICYLDTDDMFGPEHLEIITQNMGTHKAVWFNDWVYVSTSKEFGERSCNPKHQDMIGTSNVAHRSRTLWPSGGYKHDYHFVTRLAREHGLVKIETPRYLVCHIPRDYDV